MPILAVFHHAALHLLQRLLAFTYKAMRVLGAHEKTRSLALLERVREHESVGRCVARCVARWLVTVRSGQALAIKAASPAAFRTLRNRVSCYRVSCVLVTARA